MSEQPPPPRDAPPPPPSAGGDSRPAPPSSPPPSSAPPTWAAPTAPTPPPGAPQPGPFAPQGAYGPRPGGPYGYGATMPSERAGFWTRFAALLLDGLIVGLFVIPAYAVLLLGPTEIESCSVDTYGDIDYTGTSNNALCEVPTGGTVAIAMLLYLAAFIAGVVYFAKMEGGSGQTVGKKALGIRVVDIHTGQSIGTGRGVGRYFARILSGIPCYLGYLWMLWDDDKQTWHDKMTTSVVVKV